MRGRFFTGQGQREEGQKGVAGGWWWWQWEWREEGLNLKAAWFLEGRDGEKPGSE